MGPTRVQDMDGRVLLPTGWVSICGHLSWMHIILGIPTLRHDDNSTRLEK